MDIFKEYDIDYNDFNNRKIIRVIIEEEKLLAIFIQNDNLLLEVHYDKNNNKFNTLNGCWGEKFKKSSFSEEQKMDKILNLLQDNLKDYFYVSNTKKSIP